MIDPKNRWVSIFFIVLFILFLLRYNSYSYSYERRIFGDINSVSRDKLKKNKNRQRVYKRKIFSFETQEKNIPLKITSLTALNNINIDAFSVINNNFLVMVDENKETIFNSLLDKELNITSKPIDGIVVSGIYPVPGGFNKIFSTFKEDEEFEAIFQDELGNLIVVPKSNVDEALKIIINMIK